MRKHVFFAGMFSLALAFTLTMIGCDDLLGKLDEEEYTVIFDADGGTVYPLSQKVKSGDPVASLPDATKGGYTFGGWYTAKNGEGTNFTASTPITSNVTLYAKWTVTSDDSGADPGKDPGTVYDPTGTWNFIMQDQNITVTISGNTWSVAAPTVPYNGSGTFTRNGNTGTLSNGNETLGTVELTSATTMTLRILSSAQTLYGTKSSGPSVPPSPPTVVLVSVAPSYVELAPGEQETFSAAVQVSGNPLPPTGVTWAVTGGNSPGTSIDNFGTLTVGADETAPSLTVQAASTYDPAKSGTATVTVSLEQGTERGVVTLIYPTDQAAGAFSEAPIILSKNGGIQYALTVDGLYDSYLWWVDGVSGWYDASITLYASNFTKGTHQISVEVTRNGVVYSKSGSFTVTD
jgi:uncharacterized repeat protein (TIGR02543 family)